jgi:uncharacterized phage-associated protein
VFAFASHAYTGIIEETALLINRRHEKAINAVLFFVSNTHHCTRTKLMHLLYLLDFEHYKVTGRSVTEDSYCALPSGPVPAELYWELHRPVGTTAPIDNILNLDESPDGQGLLTPKRGPVEDDLTKRHLRLLTELSAQYQEDGGELLTATVCADNEPWAKVYEGGRGQFAYIPYALALDSSPHREQILEISREHHQFERAMAAPLRK